MKVYFAMFSFWKIMVVCSNHLRLIYNISASMLPHYSHVGERHWNNHAEPFEWDILLVNG